MQLNMVHAYVGNIPQGVANRQRRRVDVQLAGLNAMGWSATFRVPDREAVLQWGYDAGYPPGGREGGEEHGEWDPRYL